jgi:hypothetical protein
MRRKVFDILASAGGALIVVILAVAGALAFWGYSYANNSVHNQLAAQEITFPTKAQFDHAKAGTEVTPQMIPYLEQYAGQQLLTGAQAEAYADHFIAYHLAAMPYGGVYSKVSAASMADPSNTALAAEVQTTFRGTTLRGLLLEAYGFWTFGQIAFWGAIASWTLGFIMLGLVGLGIWHSRRVSGDAELLPVSGKLAPSAGEQPQSLTAVR